MTAAVRARALADKVVLDAFVGTDRMDQGQEALAIAREIGDPALLARALTACGSGAVQSSNAEVARTYFAEAIGLARASDDRWRLSQILARQARAAVAAPDLADAIGDQSDSPEGRLWLGYAQMMQGDLAAAVAQCGELVAEAEAAHDVITTTTSLEGLGMALAYRGEVGAARAAAVAAVDAAAELGGLFAGTGYCALATAALAAGDVEAAADAGEMAWQHLSSQPGMAAAWRGFCAQVELAGGDPVTARRWADDAVSATTGWHRVVALAARARVATAQGEPEQAERDAHESLACAAEIEAKAAVPEVLECLADPARDAGSHHEAARLFGAAEAMRQRIGVVRFKIYNAGYEASVAAVRNALGDEDFDSAWAEGAALSTDEAIAYAQRGSYQRKRPTRGWASLTPTERDVVRLVSEGLANNDIATRLFVSPRTVQTHLTHVYTKLGLTSRVQLVEEAARNA